MPISRSVGDHGQQRRHLTVMFCDVVGSTTLSSRQDVEAYFSILRDYYDACEPIVRRHGGLVAQHQGDGIFVWFGYPEPREDDAVRAVRAGLDMLAVLRRLSLTTERLLGERLTVRMAMHAGEVLVAPVDGELMPVAFGHTPNVAAKLQQAARPDSVVISDTIRHLVGDAFELRPLEPWLAGGAAWSLFEVVGERRRRADAGRHWPTPLVGREPEHLTLTEAWARVRGGSGGEAIVIAGERGIGKTRLAWEVAGVAADSGALVVDCTCRDTGAAHQPFQTLLSAAAGIAPDDPSLVAAARLDEHLVGQLGLDDQAVAVLGAMLGVESDGVAPPVDVDPVRLAQLTADLLVDWLAAVAAMGPTLVLVDDAPQADPSTLAVLARLAAAPPDQLLLVLTARSDQTLSLVATNVIELTPLGHASAQELVSAVQSAAGATFDDARRQQVLDLCDGVPLYLEELARGDAGASGSLPATLAGRLAARLGAPGIDQGVVAVLAAAGEDVEASMLSAVLEITPAALDERVAGLLAAGLVVRTGVTGSAIRFHNGLVAETAYEMLLHSQRTRLHDRLAEVLRHPAQPGRSVAWTTVGRHLRRAGRPLDAFDAIMTGAEQLRRAGAISESLAAYAEAMELVAEVADPSARHVLEVRCRLQRGIAAVSARGFGADEAVEDFGRCAELCRSMGPRPEHLTALSGVYSFYLLTGELAMARGIVEDLRTWVETMHDGYRPENELGFGVLAFFEGDYREAVERLTRATAEPGDLAGPTSSEQQWLLPFDPLVMAHTHLGVVQWLTGRPRAGQHAADQAIARASTLPFPEGPFSMAYAKSYWAWVYTLGGHHEAATRLARDVRELGVRHGFAFFEMSGEIHLAINEYRLVGRPDAWQAVTLHATLWELIRARVFLPYVHAAAASMRADMGDRAEAIAGFEAAGALTEETGARFYEAERLRLLAAALPADRRDEADELRRQAWEIATAQGATVFALRAALDLVSAGDPGAMERLITAVEAFPTGAGYPELTEARAQLFAASTPA